MSNEREAVSLELQGTSVGECFDVLEALFGARIEKFKQDSGSWNV
jgi:hypothetical protein